MKFFSNIFLICTLIVAVSCEKQPTACIEAPTEGFVVKPVGFKSCSSDEDFVFWKFGDGAGSEDKNTSYKYNTPGNYIVKLHTYSKDGRKDDVATHNVKVGFKVIDSVQVRSIPGIGFANDMKLEIDGIAAAETFQGISNSNGSLPVTFTFANNFKLTSSLSSVVLKKAGATGKDFLYNKSKADLHTVYTSPSKDLEGIELYFYWHFEYK